MKKSFLPAFRGITESEYHTLCDLGFIRKKVFKKGEVIFSAGSYVTELGLVCYGCVHIENNDLWGNKSILSVVKPGEVFAETYALCRETMMVDAVAAGETGVLFLNLHQALDNAQSGQSWYPKLQKNLLMMSAQKNIILSGRIFCTTSKTIRGRLLTYLSEQAARCGSNVFYIPFDRQQLADYLNVERSALSKEIGRMQKEGLIACRKNHFELMKIV